jgi:hypothetical protein
MLISERVADLQVGDIISLTRFGTLYHIREIHSSRSQSTPASKIEAVRMCDRAEVEGIFVHQINLKRFGMKENRVYRRRMGKYDRPRDFEWPENQFHIKEARSRKI